ncbi:Zn(II)2Cys6 transcription factor [Fusarium beomiforme]|uniref:Zn(II)2Cys6 transcription factor n=1 Tax=Fusarium beomiforme TaxID=44412 RepID=A0A9P5AF16_9HYPO|nr:Zn(II)2Cys6 transcription factor [Fusarium beomiforme]
MDPKPPQPSKPDAVDNGRDADDSVHCRPSHSFFAEDSGALDLDVRAETPRSCQSLPSPISNAVYDSGCILVQLANLPTVHLDEGPLATGATRSTPGPMSPCSSGLITMRTEAPQRESNMTKAFDPMLSPSPFGTDESLPHLPAIVAAHTLTRPNNSTSANSLASRISTTSIDQKSEIVETDPELSFFLRQFADTMGNWMDLFDMDRHYHRVIPMLAWSSPLLLYSACAVAAKQLTLVEPSTQQPQSQIQSWQTSSHKDFAWYSTKYYDRAISLLLRYVSDLSTGNSGQGGISCSDPNNGDQRADRIGHMMDTGQRKEYELQPCGNEIIIAATILSVYEFLTASDQTWSEHLDGIRSFIRLSDELGFFNFQPISASPIIDPLPPSLLRAACWNFARQDFLAAYTENPVIWQRMGLSVSKDGKPIAHMHSAAQEDAYSQALRPDIISNTLVWLLSKLANYVAVAMESKKQGGNAETINAQSLEAKWLSLNEDFETWHQGLPSSFRPSYRVRLTPNSFHHGPERSSMCASSMQSYHMSQILLLIHKPQGLASVSTSHGHSATGGSQQFPADALTSFNQMNRVLQHHAAEICAIALSRPEAAARIHMLQPVYLAGRCLQNKADRAIVIRLIESIELELGWSSKYRVEDLLAEWGMDRASILDSCSYALTT